MTVIASINADRDLPQIISVFIVSLLMLNYGLLYGWNSQTVVELMAPNHPLGITYDDASYFILFSAGATMVTAAPISLIADHFGRKTILLLAAVPYAIAWILIAIGDSLWMFYVARIFTGMGDAASTCACVMYTGEVTVPRVRGKWGNLLVLQLCIGILLTNLVGYYLGIRWTACVFVWVPVGNFLLLLLLPESPYFLIMQQREADAKQSLRWLRRREDVDEEYKQIAAAVERQTRESSRFADIFCMDHNRQALLAVLMLRCAQQFSGMSAFINYTQTIFEMAGGNLEPIAQTMICITVQLVFSLLAAVIVDYFGRRKLVFISAIGSILVLLLMSTYFFLDTETDIDVTFLKFIPLAGMIVYLVIFSIGLSIVPTLMAGELFSSAIKGKALAINNVIMALSIGGSSKLFQVLSEYGLYAAFFFNAASGALATLICYFVVPETKGRTLEEIQVELKLQNKRMSLMK